jgi:hypothetical protein
MSFMQNFFVVYFWPGIIFTPAEQPAAYGGVMMKRLCLTLVFCLSLFAAACGGGGDKPADKLNGSWTNELMTVNIDVKAGTYAGVALGQTFDNTLKILQETPAYVVFETSGKNGTSKVTAQFQPDGGLILQKEGSPLPMLMKPAK